MEIHDRPFRKTIGLLIDGLAGMGSYQVDVWHGVMDVCRKSNVNLICFPGGSVGFNPYNKFEVNRNIIYDLINREAIDGLVFTGGTIGNYIQHEDLIKFCKKYGSMPMVSVGGPIEGIHNILIDNESGLRKAILHLIRDHGLRKIAFIRGPVENNDAIQRFQVYRDCLKEEGIPYDEALTFVGGFVEQSGIEAVREFLDVRKVSFQAVVGANDNMAIGAMKELKARNYRIPSQIAIVGFDDVEEAQAVSPPLSTIRQPVVDQARKAAEFLLQIINGAVSAAGSKTTYQETEVVLRQSCGCISQAVLNSGRSDEEKIATLAQFQKESVPGIAKENKLEKYRGDISNLSEIFIQSIRENNSSHLLAELENIFSKFAAAENESLLLWNDVLSQIRLGLRSILSGEEKDYLDRLVQQSRVYLSEMVQRLEAGKKTQVENLSNLVSSIGLALGSSFNIEELSEIVSREMPRLGIRSFSLGLYENPQEPLDQIRMILHEVEGKISKNTDPLGSTYQFIAKNKMPDGQFSCAVYPLYFKNEQLGLFLVEIVPPQGFVYETIFTQLSTSIEGALLMKKDKCSNEELEKRNAQIETLVMPMIESIKNVSGITVEKVQKIKTLSALSQESLKKIDDTYNNIEKITQNTNKLLDIIKIIEEIATNINIFALNASIEATHAGVYGSGFSIIAKEIKKLSDTTRVHSVQISSTLKGIIQHSRDSERLGQESMVYFQNQEEGVNELLTSFNQISDSMKSLDEVSKSILAVMKK